MDLIFYVRNYFYRNVFVMCVIFYIFFFVCMLNHIVPSLYELTVTSLSLCMYFVRVKFPFQSMNLSQVLFCIL